MPALLHPIQRAAQTLVHYFARSEWRQIDGGKWRSSGGRVLSDEAYKRHQARMKDSEGKRAKAKSFPKGMPKGLAPIAVPAPDSPVTPTGKPAPADPGGELKYRTKTRPPGTGTPKPKPPASAALTAAGLPGNPLAAPAGYKPGPALAPAKPTVPPPTPAEKQVIDGHYARDTQRFGQKAARTLRDALSYAVGMLTAGNGLAWGAMIGGALAGPLGVAVGTGVGGAIGGYLSPIAQRKTRQLLGGRGRAAAGLRKAARTVLPTAAAGAVGATGLAGALATGLGMQAAGSAAAGFPGQVAGMVAGIPAGLSFGNAIYDAAPKAAKGVRAALARSPAAKRRAAKANAQKLFAEAFADAPPTAPKVDPVAVLKARLKAICAAQGKECKATDDMLLAALAAAAKGDDAGRVAAMGEGIRSLSRSARRLCDARR